MRKKKVAVGISGGVDSSVAAYLLKEAGYDVFGLFMINWHDTTGTLAGDCPWNDDLIFARLVARKLGIDLQTVDFSEEYRNRVVNYMFSEYEKGRTPNPDVLCNREVKFDLFVKAALQAGADFVATGHYCVKEVAGDENNRVYRLLQGADPNKDQSYFLCQLSQDQLAPALFPIGHLQKQQVREIARNLNLATAERKDSQGICFVGKVDLPEFLKQQLRPAEGDVIELPRMLPQYEEHGRLHRSFLKNGDQLERLTSPFLYGRDEGIVIGRHQGAHFYTVGQRKGLNIGGKPEPLFVLDADTRRNILFTGVGHDHPGLNRWGLFIPAGEVHWVRTDQALSPGMSRRYLVRIRYRQPLQEATLFEGQEGIHVIFDRKQRGITPGQFAAWYEQGELIGSGVIS